MEKETPEVLTKSMLNKELYVITTKPARSKEIQKMLKKHLEYQVSIEREGTLFGAGPIWDENGEIPIGGMIIVYADSFESARRIADADPLHSLGLRKYNIQKWLLNEGSMTFTVRLSDQSISF
jgi:uncharacterized protein YciI